MNRRLYKSATDKVIGGVAGGVAEFFDLDPTIVRVVWALLAVLTGGGLFLLYIIMWIVVPMSPGDEGIDAAEAGSEPGAAMGSGAPTRRRRHQGSAAPGLVFGLLLIGLGGYFLVREYVRWLDIDRLWPLGLVAVGVILLVVAIRRPAA